MALKLKLIDSLEEVAALPLSHNSFQKCSGIYIIKNTINNKLYIGESVNIWHRMYIHRSKNRKQVISKAIAKYGIENFEVYVEYLPSFTKDELLVLEQYTIEKMDSLCPNGYNVCPVGRSHPNRKGISRPTRTKDWCENLSKSLKGRIISDETKQKMSASRMGKQLSDETKSKISLKHKGRKRSPESSQKSKENHPKRRPVLQYTMDGEFVAEYMSLYDAARATGGIATNISETCKGRYNSCVGFIWKFKI